MTPFDAKRRDGSLLDKIPFEGSLGSRIAFHRWPPAEHDLGSERLRLSVDLRGAVKFRYGFVNKSTRNKVEFFVVVSPAVEIPTLTSCFL